jgi:hypothetical protein
VRPDERDPPYFDAHAHACPCPHFLLLACSIPWEKIKVEEMGPVMTCGGGGVRASGTAGGGGCPFARMAAAGGGAAGRSDIAAGKKNN